MVCFNLASSELSWCPSSIVQSSRTWAGAVTGVGLRELRLRIGVPGGTRKATVNGCHLTCVSLAETNCPALLAAALGGRQRSEQPGFLFPTVNSKRNNF